MEQTMADDEDYPLASSDEVERYTLDKVISSSQRADIYLAKQKTTIKNQVIARPVVVKGRFASRHLTPSCAGG